MVSVSQDSGATIADIVLYLVIMFGKASMEIFVTSTAGLILLVVLPLLIARMKASARLKRRRRQIGGGIDAAFAPFDPARARALQVIEMRKEIGHADEGDRRDPKDSPLRPSAE